MRGYPFSVGQNELDWTGYLKAIDQMGLFHGLSNKGMPN